MGGAVLVVPLVLGLVSPALSLGLGGEEWKRREGRRLQFPLTGFSLGEYNRVDTPFSVPGLDTLGSLPPSSVVSSWIPRAKPTYNRIPRTKPTSNTNRIPSTKPRFNTDRFPNSKPGSSTNRFPSNKPGSKTNRFPVDSNTNRSPPVTRERFPRPTYNLLPRFPNSFHGNPDSSQSFPFPEVSKRFPGTPDISQRFPAVPSLTSSIFPNSDGSHSNTFPQSNKGFPHSHQGFPQSPLGFTNLFDPFKSFFPNFHTFSQPSPTPTPTTPAPRRRKKVFRKKVNGKSFAAQTTIAPVTPPNTTTQRVAHTTPAPPPTAATTTTRHTTTRPTTTSRHTPTRPTITRPQPTTTRPTTTTHHVVELPSHLYDHQYEYDYYQSYPADYSDYQGPDYPVVSPSCPGSLRECVDSCAPVLIIQQTAYKLCVNECLDRCT